MVLLPASKTPIKIEEMRYAIRKMMSVGMTGSLKLSPAGIIGFRSRYPITVVSTEMQILAMNMKTDAIPETIENLAEFFKIRRKACTEAIQKDSFERAM